MYLSEFWLNWEKLLAATLGLGFGLSLNYYTMSLFGPALIAEFGWSRAQFALVGSMPLFTAVLIPVAGRLTDRLGPRVVSMIGFTALPLGFVGYASMGGAIWVFFAIYLAQSILGIFTTSLVFCRVIVEHFDRARGIALSLIMTAPPAAGAVLAPVLGSLIQQAGWRTGYLTLAAMTAMGGVIAIVLMGRRGGRQAAKRPPLARLSLAQLLQLLRSPTLLLIVGGMLLVNIPAVIASSQLLLVLEDIGIDNATGTWMLSLYAIGVIAGRFASGLALDRMPAHLVALASLGLPAIGYVMLASQVSMLGAVALGIGLIGLAQGAEADVGAYLISRRFAIDNFSLLMSCLTLSILVGTAVGSLVLSATLDISGDYSLFLGIGAATTMIGALLFVLTGTRRARRGTPDEHLEPNADQLQETRA